MQTNYDYKTDHLTTSSLYLGDRCDACGFQARIIAYTKLGEFWFCGNHWDFHRDAIGGILVRHHEQSADEVFKNYRSRLG